MEQQIAERSYTLEFEHRPSYLYALAVGKRESIDTCKEVWVQILAEGKEHKYSKYLIEKDFDELGTISEINELMAEIVGDIGDKIIAYVDYQPKNFQTIRLVEISASNIGINIKFFTSIGEAKEWLLLQ